MNKFYTTRNKNSNLVLIKVEKPASIWGCFTGKNKWSDLMRFHTCKLNIDLNPSNENNSYSMLQAKKKVVFKVVRKPKNRKNSHDQGMSNQYCQNIKEVMQEVMCCKSKAIENNNYRSKSAYTLRSKQTDSITLKTKVSQYNTRKQEQYDIYSNKKTKRNRCIRRSSMIAKLSAYKRDLGGSGDKIRSATSYSSNNTDKEFSPLSSSAASKDSNEANHQVIRSKEKMIELLSTKVKGLEQKIQGLQSKNITEPETPVTRKKRLSKKCAKMLKHSNKSNLDNEAVCANNFKSDIKTKRDKFPNISDSISVEHKRMKKHNIYWQKFGENTKVASKRQHDSVVRINEPMKTAESSSGELHMKNKNEVKFIDTSKTNKNDEILVKKYTFKINQNLEERDGNSLKRDTSLNRKYAVEEENNFENSEINYDIRKQTIQCTMNACKTKHITENTNLQLKGRKHTFNELIQNTSKSKHECKLYNDYTQSKEICKKNSKHTQKAKYNLLNTNDNTSVFPQSANVNFEEIRKRLKHAMKMNPDDQLYKNKCLPHIKINTAKENFKIDRLAGKKNYENSDKTEAQKRENKSNLSIHIFIDENNTFQQAIAECSIIEKSNVQQNHNVHAVSTFSQKATNVKMDSLNTTDKQVQNLYGNCVQQKKINTYENEHAIILNSCFPNQYFNNPRMLQSVSLYKNNSNSNNNDNNINIRNSIKSNKTVHELKSEDTVQCTKTDELYHAFFNGEKPEYMDSEGRRQFELNQKSIRKRIPLCRKPILYFESTDKHGCSCQCNAGNNAIKSDITHDRYDSKEMMKDIKTIQLNDCKEIEDKIELYRKFKQIIDKHRERNAPDFGNPQITNHSSAANVSDQKHDGMNNNNSNIDDKNTVEINTKHCFKCSTSTTSVAVQTSDEHLVSENVETILPQNISPVEKSESVISNSLLKQGSFLKSQISSPTDISIKNSYFTSDMITVTSQMSFNMNFIGQKFENNEAEYKAETKTRFIDNKTNLVKHSPSRARRQSTRRFNRTHGKGLPICFSVHNTNTKLKTSSDFYITSKENNAIVHCIIENLLFEISENLMKKLDKDQFQNHLDPLLRASTDYNFNSKVLNNQFTQSTVLDELIKKYVQEFNTLKTENLYKLITLLLDSACEMLYDNYFINVDYSSVR